MKFATWFTCVYLASYLVTLESSLTRLICTLIRVSQAPCKIYPIFYMVAKAPEIF